ncbi:type III pantothenate kinase [Erysipelothrix urinaevulpis]|uniref:type III pantothenate kinase n=1 Tax=Erysipelothrix urinaevulpis TaxID=2683717 RepID=UPI00135A8988|nr:type III pantothenate kinase [Erysipelothrix urinaevulpis]
MILLLNIGNTSLWSAIYQNKQVQPSKKHREVKELLTYYDYNKIDKIMIASVVPSKHAEFIQGIESFKHLEVVEIKSHDSKYINIEQSNYNFEQLGVDRMLVVDAAVMRYHGNRLVCDFGTATTFNIIGQDDGLKGGMILPGIGMSIKALAHNTGQLPFINKNGYVGYEANNSVDNIRSGVILSQLSLLENIVKVHDIETIIITGGNAGLMHQHLKLEHIVDKDLLLKGLVNFI